jgi:hypothetical protein
MQSSRAAFLLLLVAAGCAGVDQLDSEQPARPGDAAGPNVGLAQTDSTARTIQLYRTPDETTMPVLVMGRGQTLTLEFDLLGDAGGRPLTAHFYHLDRTGRRDLPPTDYLRSFLTDDLRDWRPSGATAVRYTHYTYTFPNASIDFLASGLYVIRITEVGDERAVLFERMFVVDENAADVQMTFLPGLSPRGVATQPVAELRPGTPLQDAQVFDYTVCFARDGRLDRLRCTGEPSLLDRALYRFALPREAAFDAEGSLFEIDLSVLRASTQVTSIDYNTRPFTVRLEADYERFGDDIFDDVVRTGRPMIDGVRDVPDPDVDAEYLDVRFEYVPDGERPAGEIVVTGAFDDWRASPNGRMTWNAAAGRYEGTRRIKQGRYGYRYLHDGSARQTSGLPQPALYMALVFLHDPIRITDRLVAVRSALDD